MDANRVDWSDLELSREDEDRYDRYVAVCEAHLADLKRVYGKPLERRQPMS
jgi:endonuclease YncB( thermonuclease family)